MGIAAHRFDNEKRRRPDTHARQAMLTPEYILGPVRSLLGGIGIDVTPVGSLGVVMTTTGGSRG